MQRKLILTILAGILCLSLAGCSQSSNPSTEKDASTASQPLEETLPEEQDSSMDAAQPSEETPDNTDASGKTDIEQPQYKDNFSVDAAAATEFAKQLQTVIANQDLEAMSDLCFYPLYIGFSDGGQSVESRDDFMALGAEQIFTEDLLSEIAGADTEGLTASKAGFVLSFSGRPNVVFGVADGHLAIMGINY